MNKIPYDIVMSNITKILDELYFNKGIDIYTYYQWHIEYIESCGWSNQEFDNHTLKILDLYYSKLI